MDIFVDIGFTLLGGPPLSPPKKIREILELNEESHSIVSNIVFCEEHYKPETVIESLETKLGKTIGDRERQEIIDLWNRQYDDSFVLDGSYDLLRFLIRSGHNIHIVSNIWYPFFKKFQDSFVDLVDQIRTKTLSFVEGVKKPSVEFYQRAVFRSSATPERSIVIGDSIKDDIIPFHQMGMLCFWFKSRPLKSEELNLRKEIQDVQHRIVEIDSLYEVKPTLRRLMYMSKSPDEGIRIASVERFSIDELKNGLREVTMLEDPSTKPYHDAFISLENISIEDLYPAQRYVLKHELLKIRELKWELEKHGIDIFSLNGYVRIRLETQSDPIDLIPPVVEEIVERNGRVVHVINDGLHRIYLAYLEWVIPQVVFIRGIPKHLPYYAFPIPEKDWSKIDLIDEIPHNYIKKWHRIQHNKTLYRNFNSSFHNVGKPRGKKHMVEGK